MRRLWALIKWLPADAAYAQSLETVAPATPAKVVSLSEFAQRHSSHIA